LISFPENMVDLFRLSIYQSNLNSYEHSWYTVSFLVASALASREALWGSRARVAFWLVGARNSRQRSACRSCDWFRRIRRCLRGRLPMLLEFQMGQPTMYSRPWSTKVLWSSGTSGRIHARVSMHIFWRQKAFEKNPSSRIISLNANEKNSKCCALKSKRSKRKQATQLRQCHPCGAASSGGIDWLLSLSKGWQKRVAKQSNLKCITLLLIEKGGPRKACAKHAARMSHLSIGQMASASLSRIGFNLHR